MNQKRNVKKTLLKIAASAILLTIIYVKLDKATFINYISRINYAYIPLFCVLWVSNWIFSSIRWKRLISIYEGGESISTLTLMKLYFIGAFFSNFLPTSVGGDVYKAYRLGKLLKDQSRGFAGTFMERFSGVVTLALIASVGLIGTFKLVGLALFILFWVGVVSFFVLLSIAGKKIPQLKKFADSIYMYRNRKDIIVYALVTSVLVQLCSIFAQYFIFISLGIDIPVGFALFAFPVIVIASFLIPSQNSLGVQDYLYIAFFSQVSVPLEAAASASVVFHLARLVLSLLGGLFYAAEK